MQEPDRKPDDDPELKVVSKREPTEEELADLRFAWRVCKHVKSNAIVLAKDKTLLGMGTGQPNRVTSVAPGGRACRRACARQRPRLRCLLPLLRRHGAAAAAGVTAAIEPGGSMSDEEVIAVADACEHGRRVYGRAAFPALGVVIELLAVSN